METNIKNSKLAILLHDGLLTPFGKTGTSLLRYSEADIVAVIDRQHSGESLPELTKINRNAPIVGSVAEAIAYQPDVLVIGIAPSGGVLPSEWREEIKQAVAAGLSVVNGLHAPLATDLELEQLLRPGQWIWDVRREPSMLGIARAKARSLSCRRLLTVGTDMAIGKMSTGLELNAAAKRRGIRSQFLATGQAGIIISGAGLALDAVRVDFAAGAVERAVMELGQDCDLLIVEGQGSLLHPGSTATLPLLRGAQPTHLILAHLAGLTAVRNHPSAIIPPLPEVVRLYEAVAGCGGAFETAKVAGIALNTYHLREEEGREAIALVAAETGLPCTDPVRFGGDLLLDEVMN